MVKVDLEELAESTTAYGFWTRSRKAGALFLVLGGFAAALFGSLAPAGMAARFTTVPAALFADAEQHTVIPGLLQVAFAQGSLGMAFDLAAQPGAMVFGLLCSAVGIGLLTRLAAHHFWWATALALTTFFMSFLCWQVAGEFMPVVSVARGTLIFSLPLILGALGGLLCERAGVINIAIEGQLLMGAFAGAVVASLTSSVWLGLIGAALGGLVIGALLAVFAIRYLVDQIVLGVVLYVLALGLTGYLYERVMQPNEELFGSPGRVPEVSIPILSEIPVIGPLLFRTSVFVYLALVLVTLVYFGLFYTRWGIRVRAVGEHPTAADTVGIRVQLVRYRNVLYGGMIAGLGGAFFTIGSNAAFTKNMTNGKGFIALAALIFGRWSPTGAFAAALLFGFADRMQIFLRSIDSEIDSQFLAMAPYIATLFAVAGLVGKVRPPAANGMPYVKN
ncbi:MAG: ABC transporter permease [Micromonosporaceae bacterium]